VLSDHEERAFDEIVSQLREGHAWPRGRAQMSARRGIIAGALIFVGSLVGLLATFSWSTALGGFCCAGAYVGLWMIVEIVRLQLKRSGPGLRGLLRVLERLRK